MASNTSGSHMVVRFTYDDLRLSVRPTKFEFNPSHHAVEPVAGTFAVQGFGGLGFGHHDFLGSGGSFFVVNNHDVSVTVTGIFGFHAGSHFDLHGSAASRFIADLDRAYHHGG